MANHASILIPPASLVDEANHDGQVRLRHVETIHGLTYIQILPEAVRCKTKEAE